MLGGRSGSSGARRTGAWRCAPRAACRRRARLSGARLLCRSARRWRWRSCGAAGTRGACGTSRRPPPPPPPRGRCCPRPRGRPTAATAAKQAKHTTSASAIAIAVGTPVVTTACAVDSVNPRPLRPRRRRLLCSALQARASEQASNDDARHPPLPARRASAHRLAVPSSGGLSARRGPS
eukprot:scaffold4328_cov161-Prasinococcus_capsulatus_cf.AAC.2